MSDQVSPDLLHQHWVHSHEEDSGDEMVYRPASYAFPLSRGRSSFELKANGNLVEGRNAPTDRRELSQGKWKLEAGNRLELFEGGQAKPTRVMEIASAAPDRLVVKPGPA